MLWFENILLILSKVGYAAPGAYINRKFLAGTAVGEMLDSLLALTFEHLESCKAQGRLNNLFPFL